MAEDRELIKRVLAGEVDAFEGLVTKYKEKVFRIVGKYVTREDHDEVSQWVFVKVYESLPTFREDAPFEHWLAKIAVRTCYDFFRKQRRQKEVLITSEHLTLLDGNVSFDAFHEGEREKRMTEVVTWAMGKLSVDERMVITLLYLQGHSEKESAEMLGWSVSNVKGRAFKARRRLESSLQKIFDEGVL